MEPKLGAPQTCPKCGGQNESGRRLPDDCRWCAKLTGAKLAAQKAFDTLSKPEKTFSGGLITDPLPQRVKELEGRVEELERAFQDMDTALQERER